MINFNWYEFSELTIEKLYAVLALRSERFGFQAFGKPYEEDGIPHIAMQKGS
jgi:predicted GNAT family N-acyltransferase